MPPGYREQVVTFIVQNVVGRCTLCILLTHLPLV
jgi:hypothetical protein